ncbi:MAG: hypothetical protein AAGI72_20100 [Pseudomonadota bacterium]
MHRIAIEVAKSLNLFGHRVADSGLPYSGQNFDRALSHRYSRCG